MARGKSNLACEVKWENVSYRIRLNIKNIQSIRSASLGIDGKKGIHANAQMGSRDIKRYCAVKQGVGKLLETAIDKLGLIARAYSRILKVGRTIADLEGSEKIQPAHISEAIQYRSLERRI